MRTAEDFYRAVDALAPFSIQEGFDNAGFLVGHRMAPVHRVLVALDITPVTAREAHEEGCQLIVSHHPVIFHPQKTVNDDTVTGQVLLFLIEHGIAAICAHTNLDAAAGGVNDCLAAALELRDIEQLCPEGTDSRGREYGIGRTGIAHAPGLSAGEYAAFVKEKLHAASVRFADGGRPVRRVAVGGGSCGSMLQDAFRMACDTFITADVKYDQYLEAKAMDITLMDAGHFATENTVTAPLAGYLREQFPDTEILISRLHREVYEGV